MKNQPHIPFKRITASCLFNMINYQCTASIWYGFLFAEMGWGGVVLILLFYSLSLSSDFMVIECLQFYPHCSSIGELVESILGSKYRKYVEFVANVEIFVYTVAAAIILGANFQKLALPSWNIGPAIIIATLLTLPANYFSKIDSLARLSFLGIVAVFITFILLIASGCMNDDTSFSQPSDDTTAFTHIRQYLINLGLVMMTFSNQSIIPSITREIRVAYQSGGITPNTDYISNVAMYCKICVVSSMTLTLCFNIAMAVMSYMLYGSDMIDIVTLNFTHPVLSRIGCFMLAIGFYSKIPMLLWPVGYAIESLLYEVDWSSIVGVRMANGPNFKHIIRGVSRTSLLLLTAIIAASIPVLTYVMAVGGTMLAFITVFLVPAACYVQLSEGLQSGAIQSKVEYVMKLDGKKSRKEYAMQSSADGMTMEMVELRNPASSIFVSIEPISMPTFKYYLIGGLVVFTCLTSLYTTISRGIQGP